MAQTPGDDKTEPSLELPSLRLPVFGRRKRKARPDSTADAETSSTTTDADRTGARTETPPLDTLTEAPAEAAAARGGGHRVAEEGRGLAVPTVSGWAAAATTGILVGLAGGAATYAALGGCEAVRGVSTCGGAPGFFILVAIVVLMVLFGALLLKMFRVEDAGSTSFLAVGIVTVIVMLLLLEVILSPWMFLVIPTLGAASYLLAHWVSTRFDGEDTGRRDWT